MSGGRRPDIGAAAAPAFYGAPFSGQAQIRQELDWFRHPAAARVANSLFDDGPVTSLAARLRCNGRIVRSFTREPAMTQSAPESTCILTLSCASAAGQIAAVTSFLETRGCYIDDIAVFDDKREQRFFARCVFHPTGGDALPIETLRDDFSAIGERFGMQWAIELAATRPRVLIMVSKLDHCLNDLIYRWRIGELKINIVAVVSNHPDHAPIAAAHGIRFHHLPLTPETKRAQEAALLALIGEYRADLVVLARYMQILSEELSASLSGRAINIHHSFLPGFKGARPYHQAHSRGVKLIGATAHFVTTDLDEGPIIEQVVERVDHSYEPEQLLSTGRDMECQALSRALKLQVERRVFLHGQRTVVLR
jgi:formyltetrahydrofolate deformylase